MSRCRQNRVTYRWIDILQLFHRKILLQITFSFNGHFLLLALLLLLFRRLQWTKDDFGLGWHRNLSGFERYKMIGSDEEGDFSLGMCMCVLPLCAPSK